MIARGEDWGLPASGDAAIDVVGDDAALAAAVDAHPGALIRFLPSAPSDIGRAIGLDPTRPPSVELPLDLLRVDGEPCVNMVVIGLAPDSSRRIFRRIFAMVSVDGVAWWAGRVTTVVIATGEFLRGQDVVPRGHPGDGRAEIQVYALGGPERRRMRARLRHSAHLPHPRIAQRTGRHIEVHANRPLPLEIDGRRREPAATVAIDVVPSGYRLLV